MTPPVPTDQYLDSPESEISLYDLIEFLRENLRNLILGLIAGVALGGVGALILAKYEAEIVLDNSVMPQSQSQMTFSEWNTLVNAFPALATQVLEHDRMEGKDHQSMNFLANAKWWSNHAKVVFAADKNTTKELGGVPDGMKGDVGRILQIRIKADSRKKQVALDRAHWALDFFRNAGIFLKTTTALEAWRVASIQARDSFAERRVDNTIEMSYLQKDLSNLESLIRFNTQEINERIASMNRLVSESSVVGTGTKSVFNIRGSETPEIPLDARLNELKLQVYGKEIERNRIEDEEARNQVLEVFLAKAEPLKSGATVLTGGQLLKALLEVEAELRKTFAGGDLVRLSELNTIRSTLNRIELQMVNQLPVISESLEPQSKLLIGLVGGGFGGFTLMLLSLGLFSAYRSGRLKATTQGAK